MESQPKQDGRNMVMVLGPSKKKTAVRQEKKRDAERAHEEQEASDASSPAPTPETTDA